MSRLLTLIYGGLSYLAFFLTFLYAIGFLGNIGVPKSLDSGPSDPWTTALAIDLALLSLFAVQHSLMARQGFKRLITRVIPQSLERSTYVLASSAALVLLFWQWRPLGGTVWQVRAEIGRAVLYAGFAFGWMLVLVTTFVINHFDLFGLRQTWRAFRSQPQTPVGFVTPSLYRVVRHPLYVGWLFAFWSTPDMTATHFLFAVMTTAYILVAIQFEERDLMRAHPEYSEYRRRVPMLMPGLRPRTGDAAAAAPVRSGAGLLMILILVACASKVMAQEHQRHAPPKTSSALVQVVREATERFKDSEMAEREGYNLLFGCVSGSDWGAMGLHYVNLPLVIDGELDPTRPEIVIYEPTRNGQLQMTGADYLVFAADWDSKHPGEVPQLMGQLLHLFEAPNRFGLPPFYTLHVWAWKENPNGTFVNWHPQVSCDAFNSR